MFKGFILQKNIPTQQSVIDFINDCLKYLFPIVHNEDEYFLVRNCNEYALKSSLEKVLFACELSSTTNQVECINAFIEELKSINKKLIEDAEFIVEFDPAAQSVVEVILSYPGFYAIAIYRLANFFYKREVKILPRMMSEYAHGKTGIDINAGASIGCPFFIDHGTGIVIGETTIIGNAVKLYQGVTLGALVVNKKDAETKRHPTIEDNVVIYAGSTILGGDTTIGHDCIIGGNTWITENIPPFSVVYHTAQTLVKDRRDFKEPINFII